METKGIGVLLLKIFTLVAVILISHQLIESIPFRNYQMPTFITIGLLGGYVIRCIDEEYTQVLTNQDNKT